MDSSISSDRGTEHREEGDDHTIRLDALPTPGDGAEQSIAISTQLQIEQRRRSRSFDVSRFSNPLMKIPEEEGNRSHPPATEPIQQQRRRDSSFRRNDSDPIAGVETSNALPSPLFPTRFAPFSVGGGYLQPQHQERIDEELHPSIDATKIDHRGTGEQAPLISDTARTLFSPLTSTGGTDTYGGMGQRPLHNQRATKSGKEEEEEEDTHSIASSIGSRILVSWAFQNLSRSLVPSATEIVEKDDDDYVPSDDDEQESNQYDEDDNSHEREFEDEFFEAMDSHPISPKIYAGVYNDNLGLTSPPSGRLKTPDHKHKHSSSSLLSETPKKKHHVTRLKRVRRSIRRRIFLLLTEPETSIFSALFFMVLIIAIAASNILMMMQTMQAWQFTPEDCIACGGTTSYPFSDDTPPILEDDSISCICPPSPVASIVVVENWMIYFFTVEWTLRVLCFEPAPGIRRKGSGYYIQWLSYLTDTTTVLDALAIFPYYLEEFTKVNGLLSLRLLRLFRVFQLVRLGQYNVTFISLTNVLVQSVLSFNLLLIVLIFGATFFGSIIFWLEKGEWTYSDYTDPPRYMYIRTAADGISQEPSPFTSIPASFWWFIVTATTVGYGDMSPTSAGGKLVGVFAMLTGVLVIAFPVSVFSDLWSKELKKAGALDELERMDDDSLGNHNKSDFDPTEANVDKTDNNKVPLILGFPDPSRAYFVRRSSRSDLNQDEMNHEIPSNEISTERSNSSPITVQKEDMEAILHHMQCIEASQHKIQAIFKRYKWISAQESNTDNIL